MIWTASQAPFGRLRIGGEAARWQVVEPHAVLQVADGVLDLRVAAMVGLEIQGVALPVGDEGVIAVVGEQEPGVGCTRRTMRRTGAASGLLWKGV